MKTIIMAGGRGTRISELFPDIPKPLIKVKNNDGIEKPILEWEIINLSNQGYRDIIITTSYMHKQIEDYFGDGSRLGVKISYYVEEQPLGNAGALFKLKSELKEPFMLLNADSMFDIDFNRFVKFHFEHEGWVTLFTHPNSHPFDSGVLVTDDHYAVEEWYTKEDVRPQWYKNRVNAGLHIIDPMVLDLSGIDGDLVGKEINGKIVKVDLDRDILKPLCGTKKMFCYDSPEYVKDMGTSERYGEVCKDFSNGLVQARSLKNKQKAIFLDRDGTINKHVGFLRNIDDFILLPGVSDAIKKINSSGYLTIIVTNQPVIARGEVTISELREIHNKMEALLGIEGAYINAIYYCPHHPDSGYIGEISELKINCDCRKPKPGMLLKAAQDYNIDLTNSWMIGDGKNDIQAGKSAGCHTALIGEEEFNQDMEGDSLLAIVNQLF